MKYITYTTTSTPSLIGEIAVAVSIVALAGVALMFSAVLLTGILSIGAIGAAYVWWKTRKVRSQMRQMQEAMQNFQARNSTTESEMFTGEVIEGEVIRVDRSDDGIKY